MIKMMAIMTKYYFKYSNYEDVEELLHYEMRLVVF